jgi:Zn-dependent protease with chaperone function
LALGERRLVLQEALLRAALLGGFVTASLQVGLGVRPLGGALAVRTDRAPVATHRSPAGEPVTLAPAAVLAPGAYPVEAPVLPEVATSAVVGRWFGRLPWAWQDVLAGAWTALALLALTRLVVAAVRLRQLLRQRRPLAGRDLGLQPWLVAEALGLRRVRLSAAPRLAVPLATGVLWPEVCLPTRVLEDLAPEERTALCAHELAHLARRDPAWILLARLIEALAPLQPLNRWARSRLQDIAECLSVDLAVAACGRPLGLARSLVDVASWALVA